MACSTMPPVIRLCACKCGRPVYLPHALYADPCRSARRRKPLIYVPTPEIDRIIREAYDRYQKFGNRTAISGAARKIGWPKWKVNRRAIALGIARVKESPWSPDELDILARYGWMCDDKLSDRLKLAGFHRTPTAVHLQKKRRRIRENGDWYSATQLAEAFGVDSHKTTGWIRTGLLRGARRGTHRSDAQGGDSFVVHQRDLREFVIAHPNEYDLAKVDKLWFLALVTGRDAAGEEDALMEETLP
jgi:hypothetical protein